MKFKNAIKAAAIILMASLSIFKAKAQDSTKVAQPTEVTSLNKLKLSLLGLHYEREQKIAPKATIYGAVGFASGFSYVYSSYDGEKISYAISPNVYFGFKQYYHFEQRIKKGKKTINNSSNFYGLRFDIVAPPVIEKNISNDWGIAITPNWGIQRSLSKSVNFELQLGPSLATDFKEIGLNILSGRIGFNFLL